MLNRYRYVRWPARNPHRHHLPESATAFSVPNLEHLHRQSKMLADSPNRFRFSCLFSLFVRVRAQERFSVGRASKGCPLRMETGSVTMISSVDFSGPLVLHGPCLLPSSYQSWNAKGEVASSALVIEAKVACLNWFAPDEMAIGTPSH